MATENYHNRPNPSNNDIYNNDVMINGGYKYTTKAPYSSIVANDRLTRATVSEIPAGIQSLVDIGCGDGTYTEMIRRATSISHLTGLDPAEKAIETAQHNFPDIKFIPGNILDTATLPKNRFDIAVLRGVLHHLPDPLGALKNTGLLSNGLIIVEPNGNNPILKLIERFSKYHREHHERSFSPRTMRKWCHTAGWSITSEKYVGFVPFFFPEVPAKTLHFLQPVLERVPVINRVFNASVVYVCKK